MGGTGGPGRPKSRPGHNPQSARLCRCQDLAASGFAVSQTASMENITRLSIGKLIKMTPREQDVLARQKANSGLQQIIEAVLSPGAHAPRGGPSTRLAVHPWRPPGQPGLGPGDTATPDMVSPAVLRPVAHVTMAPSHTATSANDLQMGRQAASQGPRHSAGDLGSSPGASFSLPIGQGP